MNETLTTSSGMKVNNRTWKTFITIMDIVSNNPERIIHVWFSFIYQVSESTIETKLSLQAIFQSQKLIADIAMLYM